MGTAEADLTTSAAKERAEAIRSGIDAIAAALDKIPPLIIEAYKAEDWTALGYDSWAEYVKVEFGTGLLRLDKTMRKDWTAALKSAGLKQREIAPVTNVSQMQVSRDSAETKVSDGPKKPKRKLPTIELYGIRVEGADISVRILYDDKSRHLVCPHCEADI